MSGFIALRGRHIASPLPLKNVGEFLDEGFDPRRQPVDVVRVAVVGDDRWNRGEKAERRRDQRFSNARRDLRQRRLADALQAAKRVHDSPNGAEQSELGAAGHCGRQAGGDGGAGDDSPADADLRQRNGSGG